MFIEHQNDHFYANMTVFLNQNDRFLRFFDNHYFGLTKVTNISENS